MVFVVVDGLGLVVVVFGLVVVVVFGWVVVVALGFVVVAFGAADVVRTLTEISPPRTWP